MGVVTVSFAFRQPMATQLLRGRAPSPGLVPIFQYVGARADLLGRHARHVTQKGRVEFVDAV